MGISLETSGIKVGDDKCYLVNLNADPALNELLVYYLKVSRRVSDQQTSAIPHHSSGTWMPGLVPLLFVPSINLSRKAIDSAVPYHRSPKITSVSPDALEYRLQRDINGQLRVHLLEEAPLVR